MSQTSSFVTRNLPANLRQVLTISADALNGSNVGGSGLVRPRQLPSNSRHPAAGSWIAAHAETGR